MKLFCNMRLNLRLLGMCLYRTKDLSSVIDNEFNITKIITPFCLEISCQTQNLA